MSGRLGAVFGPTTSLGLLSDDLILPSQCAVFLRECKPAGEIITGVGRV